MRGERGNEKDAGRLENELQGRLESLVAIFQVHLPDLMRRQDDVTKAAEDRLSLAGLNLALGRNYCSSSHTDPDLGFTLSGHFASSTPISAGFAFPDHRSVFSTQFFCFWIVYCEHLTHSSILSGFGWISLKVVYVLTFLMAASNIVPKTLRWQEGRRIITSPSTPRVGTYQRPKFIHRLDDKLDGGLFDNKLDSGLFLLLA